MMETLNGKVALITGGARRIGAQIARELHAKGLNIVLHYNSSETEAQNLISELESNRKDSIIGLSQDLTDSDSISALVSSAVQKWDQLDVLVNNASVFYPTHLPDITKRDWDDLVGVNLIAPLFLIKESAKYLTHSKGSVINIVDIHADKGLQNFSIYSITKAGLAMLTKTMARELAPMVRVNGVSPGAIIWPEIKAHENEHQAIIDQTALKRQGEPQDIAKAVLFLICDSDYITGQIISVDGGRSISF